MNDGNHTAIAGADTIYIVQAGDSLSKIAAKFYGDAKRYPEIAARNNISPQTVLYIGQKLIIPVDSAQDVRVSNTEQLPDYYTAPTSPGGSTPAPYNGDVIETVTTTAVRVKFWEDWRFWALAGSAIIVLWYLNKKK